MCRFAAYLGPEILISSLVTDPKHSIIHQSYQAKERVEPLNGDGFGIGWYAPLCCDSPAVFKEIAPAWNSHNLRNIARVTASSCIFAHVRAATVGGQVSQSNCHPFSWSKYLFMHNGTVYGFDKIKRNLRRSLSDEAYSLIQGNTDSEHILAMFVDELGGKKDANLDGIAESIVQVIRKLEQLKMKAGVTDPSTLNLVLSDGQKMVATRYVSSGDDSNSLYLLHGGKYHCREGLCSMDSGEGAVLIVSEPLNSSKEWQKINNNHMVLVDSDRKMTIKPIILDG